jgi:hypothetical protein
LQAHLKFHKLIQSQALTRLFGLFDRIGETRFYPTVGEAVGVYVAETGVPWVDWQDRGGS